MNARGDTRTFWVFVIIGIAVLVIVLSGVGKQFLGFIGIAKLLPSFNQTIPEGTGKVGLNLDSGSLAYFNNVEWVEIEGEENYVLGNYDFNIINLKGELNSFYFKTERRPERLILDINNWRYWEAKPIFELYDVIHIDTMTKNSFVEKENIQLSEFVEVNARNKKDEPSHYGKYSSNLDIYEPSFAELEVRANPRSFAQVIEWRDQILQGKPCEKFLTLEVKEKGASLQEPQKYTVRKVDEYLFIDLTKPVTGAPKWDNITCSGIVNYDDAENKSKLENNAKVEIYYTNYGGYNVFGSDTPEKLSYSNAKGWRYQSDWKIGITEDEPISRSPAVYKGLAQSDFYDGLILLAKPKGVFEEKSIVFNYKNEKPNEGVFLGEEKNRINIDFLGTDHEWGEWGNMDRNKELINRFIYEVLNKYYEKFLPVGVSNE